MIILIPLTLLKTVDNNSFRMKIYTIQDLYIILYRLGFFFRDWMSHCFGLTVYKQMDGVVRIM